MAEFAVVNYDIINHHLNNLRSKITNKNIFEKKIKQNDREYNCYSFVSYLFNWVKRLNWLNEFDMINILNTYCKKVATPERGDIFVLSETLKLEGIVHVGLLVANEKRKRLLLHKPGREELTVTSISETYDSYRNVLWSNKLYISYYRPKNNK